MKFPRNIWLCVVLFLSTSVYAQTNIDFELTAPGAYTASNAVSGWTISSQTNTSTCNSSTLWTPGSSEFSIVTTPVLAFPTVGNILNSPLGGNNVARLNNSTANASSTKLARTFSVTSSASYLQFAFASLLQSGHACCDQTSFTIQILSSQNSPISCLSYNRIPPGPSCASGSTGYSLTLNGSNYDCWNNWTTQGFDLTPYAGNVVTLEVIVNDCPIGDHYGTLFFDAKLVNSYGPDIGSDLNSIFITPQPPVNYCSGSNVATICAPLGYISYTWTAAAGAPPIPSSQGSLSCLTISNPIANSVYTVLLTTASGCIYTATYIISSTQVSITAVGSQSSCIGGSSGSASVVAAGSGAGYIYSWINSTNSVVSTYSTASNLSPGIYTVNVSAAGSSSNTCGNANATVSIGTQAISAISVLKPYCGSGCAYLSYPGGSNYQWYNGLTPITSTLGGNASSYTVCTPLNYSIYRLSYISAQGCHDSLQITLIAGVPGSFSVSYNPIICAGASNGTVVLSMLPMVGSSPGSNSFSVFSTGTTSAYSSSLSSSTANSFTVTNLSAGGTYSVNASDGSCNYTASFSVTPYVFNYTLSPGNSPTLCPGNSIAAGITFSVPPSSSQYSYSWSPTNFLIGGAGNFQNTIITPTAAPGSSSTIVYTVVVTPSVANCPLTKTLAVSYINPATPTISPIPNLCVFSPPYTITAIPGGGSFVPMTALNMSGVIVPTLATIGLNNFTYTPPTQGTCASTPINGTFIVNPNPYIFPSGNFKICTGQTTTLSLSGNSSTYTWSTGSNNSSIIVSPGTTTSYSVVGTSTNTCESYPYVLTVTVIPIPTLSISGNPVCLNHSGTLTALGANTYTWSTGSTGSSIVVPPNAGTIYTVTGANSQTCISSSTVQLSTAFPPTLSVSGNTQICEGQTTSLLANGASTYSWSNGVNSPFTSLSPTSTSVYSVIGTDAMTNCFSANSITVTVLPRPVLNISGDTLLCNGESTTLLASGANTYSWSTGSLSPNINISPFSNSVYTLQGMNAAGSCSSTRIITVLVNPCTGLYATTPSNETISIYPNPTSGNLNLNIYTECEVQLMNTSGELLLSKSYFPGTYNLNLSNLPAGIYFLEVRNTEGLNILKILKTD